MIELLLLTIPFTVDELPVIVVAGDVVTVGADDVAEHFELLGEQTPSTVPDLMFNVEAVRFPVRLALFPMFMVLPVALKLTGPENLLPITMSSVVEMKMEKPLPLLTNVELLPMVNAPFTFTVKLDVNVIVVLVGILMVDAQ